MREAIGGSLLFYLIIPIIIILIIFMGFIMNYASAYRSANYVVSQIESCQGYTNCKSKCKLSVLKDKYHYQEKPRIYCVNNGNDTTVYRVEMDVVFELPLISYVKAFTVKSETKSVYNTCSSASSIDIVDKMCE